MKDEIRQENKKIKGILLIILLAVIFGMASGIVGELIARSYMLDYNIPFFGEINFSNGDHGGTNLIIRDARKVIVEQDTKVIETINSVNNSLVGIFKKKQAEVGSNNFNLDNYYQINQEVGQGFIVTSDGWIITSTDLGDLTDYVVITKNKEIYTIDKIVGDTITEFNFLHVAAKDFPVRKFALANEISNGQLVLAINWDEQSFLTRIFDKRNKDPYLVDSSDAFLDQLNLVDSTPREFVGSVLFNLAGDVVGLIDGQGRIESISHLGSAINSLLKYEEVKRASLGVNYINLSNLVEAETIDSAQNGYDKGALIYKDDKGVSVVRGSVAGLAGLREGDIIVSVETIEINKDNNLTDIIQQFLAGDQVKIIYERDSKTEEVEIVLGEIE